MNRITLAPSLLALLLTSLLALGVSLGNAEAQTTACDSKIQALEINSTTLHYLECGKGEPLVFVHGGLGDLHTFQAQVQAFAASFRVIAYSRRFSPPNAPPRETDVNPLSTHVADLRALIEQLNAAPAHLVGSSYGAYIALALALAHPELVRSLVLGEPPVLPLLSRTSVGKDALQSWIRRVIEPSRKAFEGGDLEDGCESSWTPFVDEPGVSTTSRNPTNGVGGEASARVPIGVDDRASPPTCLLSTVGILGKLKRPTLLVTGERSPAMFLLITAELERCLEGESQVMVPNAGHGMHRQNTAFYNQAVLAFLQRR